MLAYLLRSRRIKYCCVNHWDFFDLTSRVYAFICHAQCNFSFLTKHFSNTV